MEINSTFLFEHELEIRLAMAVLSVVGGYALVKLYSFLSEASEFALEAYRKGTEGKTGFSSISTSAAGAR